MPPTSAAFRPPTRYPLRNRANSTPAQMSSIPGAFVTPSFVTSMTPRSEVGQTPSPLTSLTQTGSEHTSPDPLGREVSSNPSVEPLAPDEHMSGSSNGISYILSTLSLRERHGGNEQHASVEDVEDEGEPPRMINLNDQSLWARNGYGDRMNSPMSLEATIALAKRKAIECTGEQLDELAHSIAGNKTTEVYLDRDEGPSQNKGKGVDPRNWGAANIPDSELDPEFQRRAIEFYSKQLSSGLSNNEELSILKDPGDLSRANIVRWDDTPPMAISLPTGDSLVSREALLLKEINDLREELRMAHLKEDQLLAITSPARLNSASAAQAKAPKASKLGPMPTRVNLHPNEDKAPPATLEQMRAILPALNGESLRPVNQVEPTSCLGRVFNRVAGLSTKGSMAAAVAALDPSDPESDSSSDDGTTGPSGGHRSKSRSKKVPQAGRLPTLKPREPEAYYGRPDVHEFHKFMDECSNYVQGYALAEERYVPTLASFLRGKAYKYYTMMVSKDAQSWDLERFFKGLFDFCFPPDFRTSMREKLQTYYQGRQSVQEYVCGLEELFMMVGFVSPRDRVLRLWNGMLGSIRDEMYRFGLSPEVSSWDEVVAAATRFELADASRRRRGPTGYSHSGGNDGSGGGGGGGGRPTPGSQGPPGGGGLRSQPRRPPASGATRGHPLGSGNLHQSSTRPKAGGAMYSGGRKPDGNARPPRPALSDKEKADLRAAGKCFHCRDTGHLARNCPQVNNARSNQPGQPPGMSSFGVAIDFGHIEELQGRSDLASLESILCNLMDVGDDNGAEEWGGPAFQFDWVRAREAPAVQLPITRREGRARVRFGDPYSDHASRILSPYAPYCCRVAAGDDIDDTDPLVVYRISDTHHVVMGRGIVPDLEIPRFYLENPDFNLPRWYHRRVAELLGHSLCLRYGVSGEPLGDALALSVEAQLLEHIPYPAAWVRYRQGEELVPRFECHLSHDDRPIVVVHDSYLFTIAEIEFSALNIASFDLPNAYATRMRRVFAEPLFTLDDLDNDLSLLFGVWEVQCPRANSEELELFGVQVKANDTPLLAVQRNASVVRDFKRLIPESVIVVVQINGQPARALLDSGSMADFVSTKLVHQLNIQAFELEKQLPVHLAVQGSRAKISSGCKADLAYQTIKGIRYFDVANLLNYDLVLGTPFLFQHRVTIGFNPISVVVGSSAPLPLQGKQVRVLESRAADLLQDEMERVREVLRDYAQPIASNDASETPLPPLRVINHRILLKDPQKVYHWRPSKCPEALRPLWTKKRDAYLKSGRWKMSSARNTCPMLLLTKPGTGIRDVAPRLRTVFDLRERNENTVKVTSPLPDMEGILRRITKKPFRSSLDGKDAYECIRIEPEDVELSAMTSPDGNMVSLVLQQGDCNAVATYQTLMNHLFGAYIGVFMDVYLDDILVYSDSLPDHIQHVKTIVDILRREQLYLNKDKLKFLCPELKVLGRIVDDTGIRMDPDKVDSVLHWKPPTSKALLQAFLGSVGYLADDIGLVRIPMGALTELTGPDKVFHWDYTQQRAFDEVKRLVHGHREHHRVPLDYSDGAPPIWLITDGSVSGVAGVISQGPERRTAKVAAFFSAKLTPAQANYPIHEIEMLAGVESMRRHRDILLGCHFTWVTDHKGLTHLLRQKNLSARQARWIEKISEFHFTVEYMPGMDNILPDALSRLYSNDLPGTVRAASEYTVFDDDEDLPLRLASFAITVPVLVGPEGRASQATAPRRRSARLAAPAETGRPETAVEFSKRIKRLVVHGPRPQRAEGAPVGGTAPSVTTDLAPPIEAEPRTAPLLPLMDLLQYQTDGILIPDVIRGRYEEDPFFNRISQDPKHYKNFHVMDGLIILRERDVERLCIPNVLVGERNIREILISHAHSLLAHLGIYKTFGLLRDHVWWKTMGQDVRKFCESCSTCKRSKPDNQKPYGLLNPLPVPSSPWEAIGVDFVGPLPISENRDGSFDAITVVIDLLTCMVHLVPSRTTYNAKDIAELIFAEVYKYHGLPKAIISDRDVLFTSIFWTHLHKLLGVELRMSSAYHPESDGSTERANRTITQMLRQCVNSKQKDWVAKLPAIEFAINTARSESTGYAPFFLNSGRMPRPMIWEHAGADEYPGVRAYAQRVKFAIMAAHDSILAARVKQTRDANRRRRPAPFVTGDLAYVSTKNISLPKGLARKLAPKYIGPYKVSQDFKNNSYRIELPPDLKRRGIHDVFHASLLRVHEPNDDRLFPGRLASQVAELEDQDNEWMIDKFNAHRGSGSSAIFEAVWRSGDRTWVPYDTVKHLLAFNEYLTAQGVSEVKSLPEGSGSPPQDDPQIYLGCMVLSHTGVCIRRAGEGQDRDADIPRLRVTPEPECPALKNPPLTSYFIHFFTFILLSLSSSPLSLMPYRHPRLSRRSDGSLMLESKGCQYSYPVNELSSALFFDSQLREHRVKGDSTILPGFYDGLAHLWNSLEGCKFKFATFDADVKAPIISGPPIPRLELIPAQYAHSSAVPAPDNNQSGVIISSEEQQHLLLMAARAQMRLERRKLQGIADRQAKRALQPEVHHPYHKAGGRERSQHAAPPVAGGSRDTYTAPVYGADAELEDYPPDDEPMGEASGSAITATRVSPTVGGMVVNPQGVVQKGAEAVGAKGKARG
ncbi:hypothetical protein PHLCEN_2v3139 [Hermanssonia centrifuga]|uniref:RNA-directed DNA polymerase n=1 Tax=Hermanssonia centrifuga TaxID=98765 RepID=A0A2R6R100_9APHY|nr:hypothetical protein PHLCEN_2v3139 [Hermanssonia centrifuga]